MRVWKMTLGLAFVAAIAAWFAPKLLSSSVAETLPVASVVVPPLPVQTIPEVRQRPAPVIPEVQAAPDPSLEEEWMLMVDCGMG